MNIITFKSQKLYQEFEVQGHLLGVADHTKTKVQSLKIIFGIFIKSYDLSLDKIWDDFNDQTKNGCGQPRP